MLTAGCANLSHADYEAALEAKRKEREAAQVLPPAEEVLNTTGMRSLRLGIKLWRQEQENQKAEKEAKAAMVSCAECSKAPCDCAHMC